MLHQGKDSDYDFKGGAGATHEEASGVQKSGKGYLEPPSPDNELKSDDAGDLCTVIGKDENKTVETTPLRQSARTSRKYENVANFYACMCVYLLYCNTCIKSKACLNLLFIVCHHFFP